MEDALLRPWLDLVRGCLSPEDRDAVVDELLELAPDPHDLVALLTRLQAKVRPQEPSLVWRLEQLAAAQERAVRRARGVAGDPMRPAEWIQLRQVAAPEPGGVPAGAGLDLRSYEGGGFELDLLMVGPSLTGELRDLTGRGLDGVTVYLADESGRVLASAAIHSLGEFHLEVRAPRRFFIVVEGKWLRVEG